MSPLSRKAVADVSFLPLMRIEMAPLNYLPKNKKIFLKCRFSFHILEMVYMFIYDLLVFVIP